MPEKILVVEDEQNVGSTLAERLHKEGFEVTWSLHCSSARGEISKKDFDLAILDVGLPDGTGFELAELIRKASPATAVVFLTAFSNPDDRVKGLELGAEDYILKPFHLKELLLRIRNVLKRASILKQDKHGSAVKIGRGKIDFSRFEALVSTPTGEVKHMLTHKECALLKLLYDKKGAAVTRDEILDKIWSEEEYPSPRTVDNFILKLRKLLEYDPENPEIIRSIRAVGYQLVLEEDAQ